MSAQFAPIPPPLAGPLGRRRLQPRRMVFLDAGDLTARGGSQFQMVFLDALDIKFWYELEGFPLAAGWYLPDFFLPQVNLYAEAKPTIPDKKETAKCEELTLRSGKDSLFLIGPPDFRTYPAIWIDYLGLPNHAEVLLDIDFHKRCYYEQEHRFFTNPGEHMTEPDDFTPQYQEAVFASRVARFED